MTYLNTHPVLVSFDALSSNPSCRRYLMLFGKVVRQSMRQSKLLLCVVLWALDALGKSVVSDSILTHCMPHALKGIGAMRQWEHASKRQSIRERWKSCHLMLG